ncbi:MAG: hypothetical protein RLZZ383_2852 [Pseudomonadota bacterium]|jgi:hypothetical protein
METLDALRARIRQMEGRGEAMAPVRQVLSTGVAAWDAAWGGLPSPGATEVVGPLGAGRAGLLAALARGAAGAIAWVEEERSLYPPALAAAGVCLSRVAWVRAPLTGIQVAVEQVVGSGCFSLVLVDLPRVPPGAWAHWGRAVLRGATALVVATERTVSDPAVTLRLSLSSGQITVIRARDGRLGRTAPLAAGVAACVS